MSNQTKPGAIVLVPRELLKRALSAIEQVGYQDKFIDYGFVGEVKLELNNSLSQESERSTCCVETEAELEMLAAGDYTPEELYGAGGKPSCPKCYKKSPAVGGEPEIQRWHPQKTPIGTVVKQHAEGDFVTLDDHRAHVAPLLAELEFQKKIKADNFTLVLTQLDDIRALKARIAELEAENVKYYERAKGVE